MGKYIEDDTLVTLTNRNNGVTGYTLPEKHINRNFLPGQSKKVPFSEVSDLMYSEGGEYILTHLMVIEDKNALLELGMEVEPEYNYTEKEIRKILFDGTIPEFTDFLNFAPNGALEIAKEIAVREFLPDTKKRKLLGTKMNFDIDQAIKIEAEINTDEEKNKAEKAEIESALNTKTRVAAPITDAKIIKPARQAAVPKTE